MKILDQLTLVLVTGVLAAPLAQALPESEAVAGRLILRRYADAVVTIKGTLSMTVSVGDRNMPPQDSRIDVSGTVIAPIGLTVTSLGALDPKPIFESFRTRMSTQGMSLTLVGSELKDLRLVLGDGTEIPARIVGKDPDRDVALLVPTAKTANGGRSFTCVDLGTAPVTAQILGVYFSLSRGVEDLKRIPMIREVTVAAIMERPRRLFLVTTDSLGCPVFDVKGQVLGVCLRYLVNNQGIAFVVLPSADIVDAANQAAGQ